MKLMVEKPIYFYVPGDEVKCIGKKLYSLDQIHIVLPAKIFYSSAIGSFKNFTKPFSDPSDIIKWDPKIPLSIDYKSLSWSFKACCFEYNLSDICKSTMTDLDVKGLYNNLSWHCFLSIE